MADPHPEIVVMENVYGMTQVKSANMIEEIYNFFRDIGYDVIHRELMADGYALSKKKTIVLFCS